MTDMEIMEQLKAIVDPEMKFNIVDLGLIYSVNINDMDNIEVDMTLTSPGCPYGKEIVSAVSMVLRHNGFKKNKVNLVWDPPWDPVVMASERVKDSLGIW